MSGIIILLTLLMVVDSLALIGLILIQLPKKDTGGGLAFGGSTSDALFGAGSGNVLTKVTKYAAIGFFVLAVLLSILQKNFHARTTTDFTRKLSQPAPMGESSPMPEAAPTPAPANPTPAPAFNTNGLLNNLPMTTNAPAAPSTNAAPK